MIHSLENAKKIDLSQSYKATVTIVTNGHSFAGTVELTPSGITLTMRGEQSESRSHDFNRWEMPSLRCSAYNKDILLFGLEMKTMSEIRLGPGNSVSYFDYTYSAAHAIVGPGMHGAEFDYLKIYSPSIAEWVGITKTQQNIVSQIDSGKFEFGKDDNEFIACTEDKFMTLKYNLRIGSSLEEFRVGATFPPSLDIGYRNYFTGDNASKELLKTRDFLDVVTGVDTPISRIELFRRNHSGEACYLYIPAEIGGNQAYQRYSLFPLSRNTGPFDRGLPPITDQVITNYLDLQDDPQSKWHKYVTYRKMGSLEERFLGYFRLLESMVFQEQHYFDETKLRETLDKGANFLSKNLNAKKQQIREFSARIERLNKTKYNTETCIRKFMETLPTELTDNWRFKKTDLAKICKLRNDITHANNYFEKEDDMRAKILFIEVLLIINLFKQIGITLADSAKIIPRLSAYHFLEPYQPIVTHAFEAEEDQSSPGGPAVQ